MLGIVVGFLERERVVMEIAGEVDIVVVKRGRQSIPLEVRVVLCNGTSSSSSRPHRPATGGGWGVGGEGAALSLYSYMTLCI